MEEEKDKEITSTRWKVYGEAWWGPLMLTVNGILLVLDWGDLASELFPSTKEWLARAAFLSSLPWYWKVIIILVANILLLGEGAFRAIRKREVQRDRYAARLQEIEEAKPHIILRNPYTERVKVNQNGVVALVANVLRVRLENLPQSHYPNNEAKAVIAKVSFYDSSGNFLIDMDGRWTDSAQPVGPHWQSVVPLLETDFRIGAKHDLDIAFRDSSITYLEMNPGFVALNNDNFRFPGWKKPEHILVGERFLAKIRISAVWVNAEFSVEFWAMPRAEIGFSVR